MEERKDAVIAALTMTLNDMVGLVVNLRAEAILKAKEGQGKTNGAGHEPSVVAADAQVGERP